MQKIIDADLTRKQIKAPLMNKGRTQTHWERIKEIKKGDVIFSISKQHLKSINIAKSDGYVDGDYQYADIEYHFLPNAINLKPLKDKLVELCTGVQNAPFNKYGGGNQGYLFYANESLKDFFISKSKEYNPSMDFSFLEEKIINFNAEEEKIMIKEDIKLSLNTILYGPPGTGKTYSTKYYAVAICDYDGNIKETIKKYPSYDKISLRYKELADEHRIAFTTFHQSYGYEEFIEGIKPLLNANSDLYYDTIPGIFKEFCENDDNRPRVFIIDEINRGNISKIFGELITLIEPSKRKSNSEEMSCVLPYSKKLFLVPNNVYILGTMNTADRSISLMDTALRRRFDFIELMPNIKVLEGIIVEGINIEKMLEKINERIAVLYDREHTIGHSFFTKLNSYSTIDDLAAIFKNKIIPLLQEYFYDDYSKIRLVLGDTGKEEKFQFVREIKNEASAIFKGKYDADAIEEYKYEIQEKAFSEIESYKQIL
ncbi:MAG: AAA family ATPase [Erysipelotrichales bacterium]|nr:AAA family ATPase [Erysipelotrichales bacterium]